MSRTYAVTVEVELYGASDDPEDEYANVAVAVEMAAVALTARANGATMREQSPAIRDIVVSEVV